MCTLSIIYNDTSVVCLWTFVAMCMTMGVIKCHYHSGLLVGVLTFQWDLIYYDGSIGFEKPHVQVTATLLSLSLSLSDYL